MVLLAQSIGSLFGLLAVIFGAFGAHTLKKKGFRSTIEKF